MSRQKRKEVRRAQPEKNIGVGIIDFFKIVVAVFITGACTILWANSHYQSKEDAEKERQRVNNLVKQINDIHGDTQYMRGVIDSAVKRR